MEETYKRGIGNITAILGIILILLIINFIDSFENINYNIVLGLGIFIGFIMKPIVNLFVDSNNLSKSDKKKQTSKSKKK